MCKYCSDLIEMDTWECLIDKDIEVNGKRFGVLQGCIEPLPGKTGTYIYVCVEGPDGDSFIEDSIKINYCPICGEKLV